MRPGKKIVAVLLLALVSVVALSTGCAFTTDIADIKADPSQYEGKTVTIKGTASNSFWLALLTKGAYQLTDDTGSIWVVTSHTPPDKDAKARVKGTVESTITIGDRSLGTVVIEGKRY